MSSHRHTRHCPPASLAHPDRRHDPQAPVESGDDRPLWDRMPAPSRALANAVALTVNAPSRRAIGRRARTNRLKWHQGGAKAVVGMAMHDYR